MPDHLSSRDSWEQQEAKRREIIELLAQIEGAAAKLQATMAESGVVVDYVQAERFAIALLVWLRQRGWEPPVVARHLDE